MTEAQKVSALVTGGGASAGPPLGPALGPLGVNIMEIIKAINEKTKDFEGMKVPVTVSVYPDTKKWEIEKKLKLSHLSKQNSDHLLQEHISET